ncbi:FMN-binding protein [Streptomyces sp. GC420]|nr:FMN-binding protein [Streptomyces sp. GC420]
MLLALKPHTGAGTATAASPPPLSSSRAPDPSSSSPSSSSSSSSSGTVTGDAAQTRYGPVQVSITVEDGRLTGVTVLQYPANNPKDQQINNYALPVLTEEALAAQSADIDTVSGATYTSDGYRQSLQSALDRAGV